MTSMFYEHPQSNNGSLLLPNNVLTEGKEAAESARKTAMTIGDQVYTRPYKNGNITPY